MWHSLRFICIFSPWSFCTALHSAMRFRESRMVESLATRKSMYHFPGPGKGLAWGRLRLFTILHPISNVSALRCCPLECQIADLVSYPQKTNKIPSPPVACSLPKATDSVARYHFWSLKRSNNSTVAQTATENSLSPPQANFLTPKPRV